jgi:hypothetical protein
MTSVMKLHTFEPNFKLHGNLFEGSEFIATDSMIKNEPMLFSADFKFAVCEMKGLGSFVFKTLQRILPDEMWLKLEGSVIDSRSHMLMPGFYPCIPGWHHDDVPRTRIDGQPNYDNPEYKSEHLLVVIGNTAMPQFLRKSAVMPEIPAGKTVYQAWDRIINASFSEDDFYTVGSGDVYQFDWQTFHRGMSAKLHGWRYFIRFSWNTERKILNEIRNQVQVYLPDPSIGW